MNASTEDLATQIAAVTTFVHKAKKHLHEGDEVDLAGLDEQVKALCEAALGVPAEEGAQYKQPIAELSDALTELREGLVHAQDEVRGQLENLNARQKAAKAYKASELREKVITPPKKPKNDS